MHIPINETRYAGDALAVQYNNFTALFRLIFEHVYILHTFFVPFGKPVKRPHINKYTVGFSFVVDRTITKNSDKTKKGNRDGITKL